MSQLIVEILTTFIMVQLFCIVMNYGFIYARLQRQDLCSARQYKFKHMGISLLLSLPGIFSLFHTIMEADSARYGIKLFPIEHPVISTKWWRRELEGDSELRAEMEMRRNRSNSTAGRCDSIW